METVWVLVVFLVPLATAITKPGVGLFLHLYNTNTMVIPHVCRGGRATYIRFQWHHLHKSMQRNNRYSKVPKIAPLPAVNSLGNAFSKIRPRRRSTARLNVPDCDCPLSEFCAMLQPCVGICMSPASSSTMRVQQWSALVE